MTTLTIETPEVFEPLLAPARYKGAHGGRGSGKSHFFAELWLDENVQKKIDTVCIREVQKSLNFSVKKLLESKIERFNAGFYFDVLDSKITSKHGGVTIFQGMQNHTADSIKSLEDFDRAFVEEAQSLSQRSLDLLRPTIRKDDSEMWFAWNPDDESDPVDVLLRGTNPPPDSIVVQANYMDNPWLPQVLKDELEYDKRTDPDKFAHVWLGDYARNTQSRVFRNWKVEEFDVDASAIMRQGADWGFSIDPTVLVQCYIVGRKLYVPYEAYMIGCETVDIPSLFFTVPECEKWPLVADSARPETISHLRKNGFPKIMPAVKGARSLEEGIEFLRSHEIIVHPRCKHTIQELKSYSYKIDPMTNQVLPVLEDKNNHVIDALRYACEGARRSIKVVREKAASNYRSAGGATGWMAA